MTPGRAISAWAASGAAWLTGHPDGPPLDAPPGVAALVRRSHTELIAGMSSWAGRTVPELEALDAMALLGERAALANLCRQGRRSCGGSTRLVRAADGWLAVALPRPEDLEAVPAWLGHRLDGWSSDPDAIDEERLDAGLLQRDRDELVQRGVLVGLAVGALGEISDREPVKVLDHRPGPVCTRTPLVVDLSALWAGPLCSDLLARAGADVVKVESVRRPDGLRRDGSGLFDVLTARKRCVALDLSTAAGVGHLHRLVRRADVVIEGSRPRALAQLGIDAEEVVRSASTKVWLSITAHGRTGDAAMRVGFGDDAAVAGGLVAWDRHHEPCFLADAIADPLTGLVAAAAVSAAIAQGGAWLLDVALARVAATAAHGMHCPATELAGDIVARPRARRSEGPAAPLGAHTAEVLAEVGTG
jgi:crotonobetainyl-CoA:carnitine CoA-transferase CaiB-like acyl-CoA transferase